MTAASISLASTGGVWDSGVSLDTNYKCVHVNCQIIKIEILYEINENYDIKNNILCEEWVWLTYLSNTLPQNYEEGP